MDKNAIKKYAVWARNELIEKVSQKAMQYGVENVDNNNPFLDSVNGALLTDTEKKQRQALVQRVNEQGYMQVIEEVAYTWFNRFVALRFMEVNGYLPSHVRVFTDEDGQFKPQIMTEALHLEIEGLDKNLVYELKGGNRDDELFKYLLITQCNALSSIFPKMFQKISDYTELLLPDYLLREGSVIEKMVNPNEGILEGDWKDQVQIIGWLYQYYNTEPKDRVFSNLKKNIKISKDAIPAATQLFTPDWIVHYMVENSLGKMWLEGHPNEALKNEWKYYIEDEDQEIDVQKQIENISQQYVGMKPEDILCIDPCMGSGHVLCVFFDTLVKIYEDYGYPAREAAASIVEKNLWGLDIDERAAQLAYFAIMMKARQYDRRFFSRGIQPNVYAIEESNGISYNDELNLSVEHEDTLRYLFKVFEDAKEYGSAIQIEKRDYRGLLEEWLKVSERANDNLQIYGWFVSNGRKVLNIIKQAIALSLDYDVVITNPPYMGANGAGKKLSQFIKENYPDSKSDMFSVFIERCGYLTKKNGYYGMITQPSVLFLTSFAKLREKLVEDKTIDSLLHMGRGIFGIDFGSTAFVLHNTSIRDYKGSYFRLHERTFQYIDPDDISKLFLMAKDDHDFIYDFSKYKTDSFDSDEPLVEENGEEERAPIKIYHAASQDTFKVIPGVPFAYWLSESFIDVFRKSTLLGNIADSKQGIATADNNRFLREWFEVNINNIMFTAKNHSESENSDKKWYPYNKGGEFRKWYGNDEYVINWKRDGYELRNFKKAVLRNTDYYFRECFSWSLISSGIAAFRYKSIGKLFDVAGMSCFANDDNLYYLLALCNSKIANEVLKVIAPTINYQCGDIANIPVIVNQEYKAVIEENAKKCVKQSKLDWDDYEISWDFLTHPFLRYKSGDLKSTFTNWESICQKRFEEVQMAEEVINELFIDIYGLSNELTPLVKEKYITIRKADLERDVRSFISYSVGCMFGRYSLDEEGVVYAGNEWDDSKYKTFVPDTDAIIPICDDEYFSDDIVGRFISFIEIVYGKESLEENLQFIADALNGKGNPREVIRNYFINDFYADHLKIYQKRPIYWLFDSGKKNGFKCLMYMHRYQPDTIARIRTDYVHEQQARYRTAIEETTNRIESSSGSDKIKLTKKLNTLKAQNDEIHVYEEKIHHLADQMISIDLDDGVKKNYEIFKDVLAKIK